jgi:hypothetical protein
MAVPLLQCNSYLTDSIVACAAIGMDCAENTIPLLLFTGRCLETAGCCDSIILALREYATISRLSSVSGGHLHHLQLKTYLAVVTRFSLNMAE